MLTVLALGIAETAINRLFDDLSDDDKAPLVGKTLRIHIGAVLLHGLVVDVVFDTNKVRFEPAPSALFDDIDGTLSVATLQELMACLTDDADICQYATTGDTAIIHAIRHIIHTHPKSQALLDRFYLYF